MIPIRLPGFGPRFVSMMLGVGLAAAAMGAVAESKFEKEVRALEERARKEGVRTGGVMLYGSSSFRLWTNAANAFPEHRIINRGFGGSHLSDLNEFFDRLVTPAAPRVLLVYGGDNDIASGKSPEQVLADFRELVGRVERRLPGTRVAFVAIKHSPSRESQMARQQEANRLVRRFARSHRLVDFIDAASPLLDAQGRPDPRFFVADRLHMNGIGYDRWAGVVGPYLKRRDRN